MGLPHQMSRCLSKNLTSLKSTAPCSSRRQATREVIKSIELVNLKLMSNIETLGAPFSPPVRSDSFVFRANDSCDNHLKHTLILALARVTTHFLFGELQLKSRRSSAASPLLRTLRASCNTRIRNCPRSMHKRTPSGDQGECAH